MISKRTGIHFVRLWENELYRCLHPFVRNCKLNYRIHFFEFIYILYYNELCYIVHYYV